MYNSIIPDSLLPCKVCPYPILGFRQSCPLFSQRYAFHQEYHISGEDSHDLSALFVNFAFTGLPTVNIVPVLAGCHRHIRERKELIEFIKCRGTPPSVLLPCSLGLPFNAFLIIPEMCPNLFPAASSFPVITAGHSQFP